MKTYSRVGLCLYLMIAGTSLEAQERETLLDSELDASFSWHIGLASMSTQSEFGTGLFLGGGLFLNNRYYAGLAVGSNLSHSNLNDGFFGVQLAYIDNQERLLHWRAQLWLGSCGVKEYVRSKSGLMDDFGNVFGASFFAIEPSVHAEINLSETVVFTTGLGYRLAAGLDETDPAIAVRKPTSSDMSGIVWDIGIIMR